jgi:hypothetical protein
MSLGQLCTQFHAIAFPEFPLYMQTKYFRMISLIFYNLQNNFNKPWYGLDVPGVESEWRRNFPHLSIPALWPTSNLYNEYPVFPGVKERPAHEADPKPPTSAVVIEG